MAGVAGARSGLQPHVVWAALGVTIARGEAHDALWGSPRDRAGHGVVGAAPRGRATSTRMRRLPRARARARAPLGVVGNQTQTSRRWARETRAPRGRRLLVGGPGRPEARPEFFERVVELWVAPRRGRVRRRPRGQRRRAGRRGGARRGARAARSLGPPAADAARRPSGSARSPSFPRVSLAAMSTARLRLAFAEDACLPQCATFCPGESGESTRACAGEPMVRPTGPLRGRKELGFPAPLPL